MNDLTDVRGGSPAVPLGQGEARELTEQVKREAASLWMHLVELYERQAHVALGYGSWDSYFETEFGHSHSRAYQLLDAGRVYRALAAPESQSTIVDSELSLPTNEAQARELARLHDPEPIREVWQSVVEEHGPQITAKVVREAVNERLKGEQPLPAMPPLPEPESDEHEQIVGGIFDLAPDIPRVIAEETHGADCMQILQELNRYLRTLDPAEYAAVLGETERTVFRNVAQQVDTWVRRVNEELSRRLRLVRNEDDDDDLG